MLSFFQVTFAQAKGVYEKGKLGTEAFQGSKIESFKGIQYNK